MYGIEAGVLWPCVDTDEFPEDPSEDPENPFPDEGEYVVSVGRASYAKGTWETISMLAGTGLSLAHVGGGDEGSLDMIRKHADSSGVGLWVAPRLPSPDLVSLMRGARAIVSMAHKESFGLTPIEAFAVGTPPLFVDEGGWFPKEEPGTDQGSTLESEEQGQVPDGIPHVQTGHHCQRKFQLLRPEGQ